MENCEKCNSSRISVSKYYKFHNVYECENCGYLTFVELNDCCRDSYKIYVIDWKNEKIYFIREQCINCGACKNKNRALSSKKYRHLVECDLNTEREKIYKEQFYSERKILYDLKNLLKSKKYQEYLYSDEWRNIRNKVLERDNSICRVCEKNKATEVHHLTYENIYNEKLEDLISICRNCHNESHFPSFSKT